MNRLRVRMHALAQGLPRAISGSGPLANLTRVDLLVLAALAGVYLATRLARLADFPVYFFCDEATQANLAEQLLRHGFRAWDGTFPDGALLPSYFNNAGRICLSLSVYLQAIAIVLFGKSLFITRATSAIVSVLGTVAVALALRLVFRLRLWWLGLLLLTVTPIWFLHSRTAFESVMMVSFYGCFVFAYLMYRCVAPIYLYPAIAFGAATFYAYSNGQGLMFATGALLLVVDLPYHLRVLRGARWKTAAVLALLVVAAPYLRLREFRRTAIHDELQSLGSYWVQPITVADKLARFTTNYITVLRPSYWFAPNFGESRLASALSWKAPLTDECEVVRHTMKGLGNLPLAAAPFLLLGLGITVRRSASVPAARVILITVAAVPFTASLVAPHVQRVMAMIVPATMLTVIGLEAALSKIRRPALRTAAVGACAALCLLEAWRLPRYALREGPRWSTNYSLYGLQYGAKEVFGAVRRGLERSPNRTYLVSTAWANNPAAFVDFFLPAAERSRATMFSVDDAMRSKPNISANAVAVLTPEEFDRAVASGKFTIGFERVLVWPDGRPGFYFTRLAYVAGIDAVFDFERSASQPLDEDSVEIDGQKAAIRHSPLDFGSAAQLFDGDVGTVARGEKANPLVLEVLFPRPRPIRSVGLDVWLADFTVAVHLSPVGSSPPVDREETFHNGYGLAHVEIRLPETTATGSALTLQVCDDAHPAPVHIHVAEIRLR